ncbi:MAG: hypothetical protein COB34_02650 [Methylophilaceae bacterium]|nr:MAG: hypothetical protein COB34_02650 [Methylophilaceae bacterium]
MLRNIFFMFIALFTSASYAHPGHDHGHWLSNTVHLSLGLAVVGIIAVGIFMIRRKKQLSQKGK